MINTLWNPDVEVAVHDDELIVKLDHLPAMHRFEAERLLPPCLLPSALPPGG